MRRLARGQVEVQFSAVMDSGRSRVLLSVEEAEALVVAGRWTYSHRRRAWQEWYSTLVEAWAEDGQEPTAGP